MNMKDVHMIPDMPCSNPCCNAITIQILWYEYVIEVNRREYTHIAESNKKVVCSGRCLGHGTCDGGIFTVKMPPWKYERLREKKFPPLLTNN